MQEEIRVRRKKFIDDYTKDREKYKKYAQFVLDMIKSLLSSRQIDIAYASSREKEPESLVKKCQKQITNKDGKLVDKYTDYRNEIMDLAGVRIVTYVLDDVKRVSQIIQELFQVIEEHSGDKLDLLGADRIGYLSVHYVIQLKDKPVFTGKEEFWGLKCEIQVRTVLEDAWAQIFHDRQYKNELHATGSDKLLRRTNLLSGNLELLDYQINRLVEEYDALNQMERYKSIRSMMEKPATKENILSYLRKRLGKKVIFYYYKRMEELLKEFGVINIRALEMILRDTHCEKRLEEYPRLLTADKVISYILIIKDSNKFFEKVKDSVMVSTESYNFLKEYIDIRKLCEKYNVKIEQEGDN